MEFITLLLSGHLILIFVTAFSPDENLSTEFGIVTDKSTDNFNLSDHILPTFYDIELVLDIEKDIFYGSCNISINILKDTRNIHLHSANLNITGSTLFPEYGFESELYNITYIIRHEIVSLDFEIKLSSIYNYTLHITFTGIISNTGGLFKTSYINKEGHREWVIAKYNSVIGTRRLFPCWDEPRFKANFSISLKHHNNYSIFSNMPTATWSAEKEMIVTRFATTPAIPTYLIAIVLMRLSSSSIYSMDDILWGRSQAIEHLTYAADTIAKLTQIFENEWVYLEDDYYLNRIPEKHITFPGWLDDGMDKWHIVLYREANIIFHDKLDPIARKIEISRLIVRKLAGQWIDSGSYSSHWSHMWLHESISTLLGINILNKTIPDFRMMDLFVVQTLQESLRLDKNTFMKSVVSEADNIFEISFSFVYYLKGPVILRMLQHALGSDAFQEGINIYLKMQLSSLDSFWTAMQAARYNKTKRRFDIKGMMDSWINKNYYPILNIKQNHDLIEILMISIETDTWWIPVSYSTNTQMYFNKTSPNLWLNQHHLSLDLLSPNEHENWIIFNLQQTGYYRVNYYTENWRAIADYLSSKNYTNVHVLNRAQIIDDAFYFMIMSQLEPSIFWKLTNFLSQESDYIVWYPMFKAIEYMSCSNAIHQSQMTKIIILNLLGPLLDKIGYEEHSEDNPLTKCLRQEAAKWACVLGHNECQNKAKALLSNHLSNPKTEYFLPWWKKWTYCHGLSRADVTLINKVYETYSSEKNNTKALEFLSCSNNYSHVLLLLKKVMKSYSLSNQTTGGPIYTMIIKDYINMFHHIVQRHAKNIKALQYILSNWEEIKPKEISSTTALIDVINHVYFENQLNEIRKFVKNVNITLNFKFFGSNLILLKSESITEQTIDEIIKKSCLGELISKVQRKIDTRLFQIKRHTDSLSNE